jgi:TRAP transporter T-component
MSTRVNAMANRFCCRSVLALVAIALSSGCASIANKAADKLGSSLTAGISNHDDPDTVAAGLPAYLILIDGFIAESPDNAGLLLSGAKLYSAYSGGFVLDAERRKRLAERGFDYARRGICARSDEFCAALNSGEFAQFEKVIAAQKPADIEALYTLASSWASWLQADTGDWARIADLPRIEAALTRVWQDHPDYDNGNVLAYLGVLDCLRPESLGGKPERGRDRLEQAFQESGKHNLMPKVLQAEFCARLLFDQAAHDAAIAAVLEADANSPGLTLSNVIAKRRAAELLESGKDFF